MRQFSLVRHIFDAKIDDLPVKNLKVSCFSYNIG